MDITSRASECLAHFGTLMRHPSATQEEKDWAEDQRARLNLWADSLGVFARSERYSVQNRLRDNAEVARVITQLLEDLISSTLSCINKIRSQAPVIPTPRSIEDHASDAGSEDSDESSQLGRSQQIVVETLNRLVRLSILLRRETAKDSDARAYKFEPLDRAGQSMVEEFTSYVDIACKRAFDYNRDATMGEPLPAGHPADDQVAPFRIAEYLRERVQTTMIRRWRRLSYQLHQIERSSSRQQAVLAPLTAVTSPEQPTPTPLPTAAIPADQPSTAKRAMTGMTGAQSQFSSGTAIRKDVKIDKLNAPPTSVGSASVNQRSGQLSLPKPPEVDAMAKEFFCVFCRTLCSTQELKKHKWRQHVLRDFEPYICIFPDCDTGLRTYRTSDLWIIHLQESHAALEWHCQKCPGEVFHQADMFARHLRQHFPAAVTDEQLGVAVGMQGRKVVPGLAACVFCGWNDDAMLGSSTPEYRKMMHDHMETVHMHPLALTSTPWDAAASDAADSDRQTHVSLSTGVSNLLKRQILTDESLEIESGVESIVNVSAHSSTFAQIKETALSALSHSDTVLYWRSGLTPEDANAAPAQSDSDALDTRSEDGSNGSTDDTDWDYNADLLVQDTATPPSTSENVTTLHYAVKHHLLDHPAMLNVRAGGSAHFEDLYGFTPLHLAAWEDHADIVQLLIKAGCDPLYEHMTYGTALSIAVLRGSINAARVLVGSCDVNVVRDPARTPPLHLASMKGNVDMISLLLSSEAVPSSLEKAVLVNHDFLRNARSLHCPTLLIPEPPNPIGALGLVFAKREEYVVRPLALAAYFGHVPAMRLLLDFGHEVDKGGSLTFTTPVWSYERTKVYVGVTPLILAAAGNHIEALELLYSRGAHLEQTGILDDNTAASVATTVNAFEAVRWLAQNGADMNCRDGLDCTPLINAAASGFLKVVQFLVEHGVSTAAVDKGGQTALMSAAAHNHFEIIPLLLPVTPNLDQRDDAGNTVLSLAAPRAPLAVLRQLLDAGLDPNCLEDRGESCLSLAIDTSLECFELLLERGADIHRSYQVAYASYTILHMIIRADEVEKTAALLKRGAMWESSELLCQAGCTYSLAMAQLLLVTGANVNELSRDGDCALSLAVSVLNFDLAKLLLQYGAQPDGPLNCMERPIMVAAGLVEDSDAYRFVRLLLDHGANADTQYKSTGETALTRSAGANNIAAAELLLRAGAVPVADNITECSAFVAASYHGNVDKVKLLLTLGGHHAEESVDFVSYRTTALLCAVVQSRERCAQLLIDAGADVNYLSSASESILAYALASANCSEAIVRLLLSAGADVSYRSRANDGMIIHYLTNTRRDAETVASIVGTLCAAGGDVNDTSGGHTALRLAVAKQLPEVLQVLLDSGAQTGADSALAIAVQHCGARSDPLSTPFQESKRCLEILLAARTAANDYLGITKEVVDSLLHKVIIFHHEALIQPLLNAGADDNAQEQGATALMRAIAVGRTACVTRLLGAGADPTIRDSNGRTAADYAFSVVQSEDLLLLSEAVQPVNQISCLVSYLREHYNAELDSRSEVPLLARAIYLSDSAERMEVIRQLLQSGADSNIKIGDDPLLHKLVGLGDRAETIQQLLDSGADPRMLNGTGMTALMLAVTQDRDAFRTILYHLLIPGNIIEARSDCRTRLKSYFLFENEYSTETAISLAMEKNDKTEATDLLALGADVPLSQMPSESFFQALHDVGSLVRNKKLPDRTRTDALYSLLDSTGAYDDMQHRIDVQIERAMIGTSMQSSVINNESEPSVEHAAGGPLNNKQDVLSESSSGVSEHAELRRLQAFYKREDEEKLRHNREVDKEIRRLRALYGQHGASKSQTSRIPTQREVKGSKSHVVDGSSPQFFADMQRDALTSSKQEAGMNSFKRQLRAPESLRPDVSVVGEDGNGGSGRVKIDGALPRDAVDKMDIM